MTIGRLLMSKWGASFVGVMMIMGVMIAGVNVRATSSSATASVTVSAACTLSGANHNYYDTISGGETKTFGPSSIKATCNDTAGYSLYAIGFSGDSYSGNNTKMIGTNASIDTATSGNTSRWSMQVASVAGTYAPTILNSFDSAHVIPADYAQVAKYTSLTDGGDNAEGSNLQVSYTVSISSTQAVDTYTGKVKYTLVHPNNAAAPVTPLPDSACPAQSICYAPNAGDIDGSMSSLGSVTGSSTAGKRTGVATNGTAVLIAPNFSRDGYGFAGWSPEFDATTATNPVIFGPNQTITTSTSGTGDVDISQHGLILYPVWLESKGTFQSWTGCNSLTIAPKPSSGNIPTLASMTALTDNRDNNTYAVARLADGNCWMVENLRLNESVSAALISSGSQGIGGDFTALPNSENAHFANSTTANNLYNTGNAYTMPRYNSNNTNRSLDASYSLSGTNYRSWYSYGNYYTWAAAMANTNTLSSYSASESAGTSLCPTGWHIPTGGDKTRITSDNNNEFWNLIVVNLNNNTLPANYDSSSYPYYTDSSEAGPVDKLVRAFPNNFVYSGGFNTASAYSRGSNGYYWSSSASASSGAYYLSFDSSYVYPGTNSVNKCYGRAVRCLLSS